jgi:maleylacetoacetate isomerase/maleylpyruvate isomerase
MKLYSYFRSSASYRVRIALAFKGIAYDYQPIHLVKGEQRGEAFAALSADRLVPVLEVDGVALSQSLAIIDYLEETHPEPRLLPAEPLARAQVRALAQTIACEIHPINNLRVLKYLAQELKVDDAAKNAWYRHWCRSGLEAVERQLAQLRAAHGPASLCFGDSPTLADCCLVPQIFNAQRFAVDLSGLPLTMAAYEAGMALPAVQQAQPSACPDFEA